MITSTRARAGDEHRAQEGGAETGEPGDVAAHRATEEERERHPERGHLGQGDVHEDHPAPDHVAAQVAVHRHQDQGHHRGHNIVGGAHFGRLGGCLGSVKPHGGSEKGGYKLPVNEKGIPLK